MHNRSLRLTPLEVGPVPSGWQIKPIGDVSLKVRNGFVGKSVEHQVDNGGVLYLQGFNIRPGKVELKRNTYVSNEFHLSQPKSQLKPGDVLVVQSGHIGTSARVPDQFPEANCHALIIVDPHREAVDPDFLVNYLNSDIGQRRMQGLFVGSSMPHINTSELSDYRIPVPPISEQRAIAEILRTWDEAIEACERLRFKKIQQATWFRTDLFTGKVRLKGLSGEWRKRPLGAVLTEHGLRSAGTEEVFSVSVHRGLVNQIEHLGRSFAAKETAHYNRVLPGDIVYTKSPTGDFPLGIIKQSNLDHDVIVSPLYGVFTPATRDLGVILDAYFRSPVTVRNYLAPLVQKGAKNTIAITNSRFLEGELNLPLDPKEHRAIAEVIEDANAEIAAIEREMAAYQFQKRGLMQKLLTGDWRVKVGKETAHG